MSHARPTLPFECSVWHLLFQKRKARPLYWQTRDFRARHADIKHSHEQADRDSERGPVGRRRGLPANMFTFQKQCLTSVRIKSTVNDDDDLTRIADQKIGTTHLLGFDHAHLCSVVANPTGLDLMPSP